MAVRKRRSQRAANVAYYWRNRDLEIQRVRLRQDGTVHMLRELRRVPCADCGGQFEPYQMEFDHRDPSTKLFNLMTGRAMLMSQKKLLAEAAKCDVVCVNCHRLRTTAASRTKQRPVRNKPSDQRKAARWKLHSDLLDHLRNRPCLDCGGVFPPCAMDFDHRVPAAKRFVVSRMRARATIEEILAEVAKCDIVCGNCHRLRTHRRLEARFERE
jgi:hypothetical protein